MLYQLSYASVLERETGIEPATNSLEGCDSTIELLPRVPNLLYLSKQPLHATMRGYERIACRHRCQSSALPVGDPEPKSGTARSRYRPLGRARRGAARTS